MVTVGANHGSYGLTIGGARVGLVLVVGTGRVVHRPLSNVPENHIKFAVGGMLTSFGTFWAGEGIGIDWPAGDVTLLYLLVGYTSAGLIGIWLARSVLASRRLRRAQAQVG